MIQLSFTSILLPFTASVVDKLDSDILAGVPVRKYSGIKVHRKDDMTFIGKSKIKYGSKPPSTSEFFCTECFILRSDSLQVVLSGEYIEFSSDTLKPYSGNSNSSILTFKWYMAHT